MRNLRHGDLAVDVDDRLLDLFGVVVRLLSLPVRGLLAQDLVLDVDQDGAPLVLRIVWLPCGEHARVDIGRLHRPVAGDATSYLALDSAACRCFAFLR